MTTSAIMRWATASRPATAGSREANPAIPRGRPAGSKNLATLLTEALNEPVIVAENGGRRKISKREAIIKQLVNRSAKADWRAIKILLDIVQDIEGRIEPETAESSFSAADEKVIEQIKARWHAKKGDSDD